MALVGAVAKRLICGKPATAKRDRRTAAKSEGLALLVDQIKVSFNAKRAVVKNGYFSSSHKVPPKSDQIMRARKAIPR